MIPRALTIAGSDSGGGAGIQADLKTFFALGVHGTCAITALTAQDTLGVHEAAGVDAGLVLAQIDRVVNDIGVDAVKTGMLWSAPIVAAVAGAVRRLGLPNLVVDPVLAASHGQALLTEDGINELRASLLPLATLVTPNLDEAAVLAGMPRDRLDSLAGMREAARRIHALGPRWVVVKGGHLPAGMAAVDLLYNGREFACWERERLAARHTHGTGCTFSAAVAAGLAKGLDVPAAVAVAKSFVTAAIRAGLALGGGRGPVNQWAGVERGCWPSG